MIFPKFPRASASVAILSAVCAAPAMADVTAEEVWQNWQDASAAMGQTLLAANVAREGDTLIITSVTIASAANGVTVEGSLDQIAMQDQGDGTVLVTMSPEYPIKMRLPNTEAGKPEVQMDILVSQSDLTMLASGTADAISYALDAPEMKIKLERGEGVADATDALTLDATLTGLTGTYGTQMIGGQMVLDSDVTIAGLAIAAIGTNPAEGSELRLTAAMTGAAIKSTGGLMGALGSAALTPEVMAEINSTSAFSTETTEFDVEIVDATGRTALKGTMGAGSMTSAVADGVMSSKGNQTALDMTITAPSIPLPDLSIALEVADFAMTSPLVPSDVALPFALSTSLTNLALSDQLWAMFDPTAQLPRDPINLAIEADGTGKLQGAAPAGAAPDMMAAMPVDMETLNLKRLNLSVAGAALTGAGTSTFVKNAEGSSTPDATLDFSLTGANALMDRLVAAGLMSPEMLTMPRMMLAMVARPAADGSDTYTSQIEIKDKAIFANGQKLHQMD